MSVKSAFITGITGQDGSYLAEFLLSKGYDVYGMVRRSSTTNTSRIDHILKDITVVYGDMTDSATMSDIISLKPDEVYNLAAQSHVGASFQMPEYTGNVTGLGTTRLLEAIYEISPDTKFYQASSSELFGNAPAPQNERTPMHPRSPYAIAKLYAYWMTKNYRERGLFAVNGIAFNHESPRRGEQFVTRKITKSVARILAGKQEKIALGNLDAHRDWGFAPDYVEAMWKMLQAPRPTDYVLGTGWSVSVRGFLKNALDYSGLRYNVIESSSRNDRPTEVDTLWADGYRAYKHIGFSPTIQHEDIVKIMIDADMRAEGLEPIGEGDAIIAQKYPNKWWKGD